MPASGSAGSAGTRLPACRASFQAICSPGSRCACLAPCQRSLPLLRLVSASAAPCCASRALLHQESFPACLGPEPSGQDAACRSPHTHVRPAAAAFCCCCLNLNRNLHAASHSNAGCQAPSNDIGKSQACRARQCLPACPPCPAAAAAACAVLIQATCPKLRSLLSHRPLAPKAGAAQLPRLVQRQQQCIRSSSSAAALISALPEHASLASSSGSNTPNGSSSRTGVLRFMCRRHMHCVLPTRCALCTAPPACIAYHPCANVYCPPGCIVYRALWSRTCRRRR